MSASFVPGPDSNAPRQRHAPLYGRLVAEEHLPPTHRDAMHQVSMRTLNWKILHPHILSIRLVRRDEDSYLV